MENAENLPKDSKNNESQFWHKEPHLVQDFINQFIKSDKYNFKEPKFYITSFIYFQKKLEEKRYSSLEFLQAVLEQYQKEGLDINYQGPKGQTLAHFFLSEWNLETIKLLLQNKADFQIKDQNGSAPLDVLDHFLLALVSQSPEQCRKSIDEARAFVEANKKQCNWNGIPLLILGADPDEVEQIIKMSQHTKNDECNLI